METKEKNDNLAEILLMEIRKTNPNACLGFPPPEELQRFRNKRHAAFILEMERREGQRRGELETLKQAALANLRRDRS